MKQVNKNKVISKVNEMNVTMVVDKRTISERMAKDSKSEVCFHMIFQD